VREVYDSIEEDETWDEGMAVWIYRENKTQSALLRLKDGKIEGDEK